MWLYSKEIIQFIGEIQKEIQQILSCELGFKVVGNRFHCRRRLHSYPIKVVVYNHKSMLGYFDPEFYEMGFHARLIPLPKEQRRQIIQHELAHYITFIDHGPNIQAHGPEFKALCRKMDWGEEVARACFSLESNEVSTPPPPLLKKIQKLMALSQSSNAHEAQLAMVKSQQLLLKYNINDIAAMAKDPTIFLKRILKQKKETAKMRAIAIILETFFVSVVYHRGDGVLYLEIAGEATNIEIAEYVAEVLQNQLELLWIAAKKDSRIQGKIAKNSFFLGVARGYCQQVKALEQTYEPLYAQAVMKVENHLTEVKRMIYSHLSHRQSTHKHCSRSAQLGEQAGKNLRIRPGVGSQEKSNTSIQYQQ